MFVQLNTGFVVGGHICGIQVGDMWSS